MSSVYENVGSNLEALGSQLSWGRLKSDFPIMRDICISAQDQIVTIVPELKFLARVEDCIRKWIKADVVVQHLAVKFQATSEEIVGQVEGKEFQSFRMELLGILEGRPSIFFSWARFQEKGSEILDVFAHLNAKINFLKQEIGEACKNLLGRPFQPDSPMADLIDWKEFVISIDSYLLEFKDKYTNDDSWRKVEDFRHHLANLQVFLDGLPNIPTAQDFSIQVANVAIRAGLVSFQWWASQFDPNMEEDVVVALSDLQRSSCFTDPELLAQVLRLLKTLKAEIYPNFSRKAIQFVRYLLPFTRRFEKVTGKRFWVKEELLPFVLMKEMESLTSSILPYIPDEGAEDEQCFLLEFKLLISEIEESFSYSLLQNWFVLLNLLAKVWLLKIEAFIVEQLHAGDDVLLSKRNQIDTLNQGAQQIRKLSEHGENVNQILKLMEEVVRLVADLHRSLRAKGITRDGVRTVLLLLLIKIILFKLDGKLQDCNEGSIFLFKERVEFYLEGSKFLINCLNQQGMKDGEWVVERVEAMARRSMSLYHSLPNQNITEEIMKNLNLMLSVLQDEIKLIMAELREICLPIAMSNFPKTNALGFFDGLLTKLRELLLNYKGNFFVTVKQYIEEILSVLEFFRNRHHYILQPVEEEIDELTNLGRHVIDAAYETEYFVDSIVAGEKSECQDWIWLYHLLQNIRHVKMQANRVSERKTHEVQVHYVLQISRNVAPKTSAPRIDDVVLTLSDQQELIIDRLLGGYPQRDIVSIVGMPGIGKTTLAMKVYSSPIVACHFHIRAWCSVTEVYRKRELLLQILSHIIPLTDYIRGMSGEDLDFKLRQLLLKKKYLIVMDDMWSTEAWDDLRTSLPDDENGSRILITSRLHLVSLKAKGYSDAHHLRQLSAAESWKLLQMRAFGDEACPEEFIKVGQEIAEGCKGLPLAIVAMAGLLQRMDRQHSLWEEIAKNLSSQILNDPQERCRDILELSYKLLPNYLKACFLYFGAFLEDQEIPVKKLIRLWIAEGFVQKTETELGSLEDLAEDYLNDLIGRSLVIFAQPRFGKGTKACRVHDMLRSLCQTKAKEDNFLKVITRSFDADIPFDDLDLLLHINFSNPSNNETCVNSRLCFYSTRNHFTESRPSSPHLRSLLFFATNDKYARSSYDISFIFHNFIFLKVLDLECINMGPSFPSGIELMAQLRYLAVSGDVKSVPSSIVKLSNLETFILKGLKGKVNLPHEIWCLKKLRHVHVSDVALINWEGDQLGNFSQLKNLCSLSSPILWSGQQTDNMLKKFPNLQKLGCIFLQSPDFSGSNPLPRLDVLTQLESLKITYYGRALHSAEFVFPLSLKKLTLSNCRFPWSEISVMGRLQNLEVLKLLSRSYEGEVWDMQEEEFRNLKFIKLDTLDIVKWNVSYDNLPSLEQLVLRNCKNLEEVPSSFEEFSTLQKIEVQWCGKYAEESARRMREVADENLKIIITSDLDSNSAF